MGDSLAISAKKQMAGNLYAQNTSINTYNKDILGGGGSITSYGEGKQMLFSSNASACKNVSQGKQYNHSQSTG